MGRQTVISLEFAEVCIWNHLATRITLNDHSKQDKLSHVSGQYGRQSS
jgi:hypothetical protein